MGFKLKSGNKISFKKMGSSPAKQKTAIEAIKEVDSSTTGYSNQDKSKMHTEREVYKAKLRGDYIDLRGKSKKEQKKMLKKHGITEPEWYKKRSPAKQDIPQKQIKNISDTHPKLHKALLDKAKKKKLDHIGTGFMNPPYKDTVKLQKAGVPYEKRQGYHGFKDFDSILSKKGKKSPTKHKTGSVHTHKDDLPKGYERGKTSKLKDGGTMTVIKKKEEEKKVYAPGETRIIKSGDKEYVYTPPKKKKSKRSKVKRTKRPKARKVKNLVTGGYNILR